MSDYFDQLELELRAAVTRGAPQGSLPRVLHRSLSGLVAALGVAVAVAVAVLAVALLGHGEKKTISHVPPAHGAENSVPTLAQLLANFAILRRPQTAGERSFRDPGAGFGARGVRKYTRLARILANGDRVYLTVERFRFSQLGQAAGTYSLSIWVVSPDGNAGGTNFGPNVNYTVIPLRTPGPGQLRKARVPVKALTLTSIIPDGVSRVRWTFVCDRVQFPQQCVDHHRLSLEIPVRNNIAAATIASSGDGLCVSRALVCRPPTAITWYGAGGRAVLKFGLPSRSNLTGPPFVRGNPTAPLVATQPSPRAAQTPRDVLGPSGIGSVRFGQRPGVARAALRSLLGEPGSGYLRGGDCGPDHVIVWPAPGARSVPTLTVYFRRSRFIGYQYGEYGTASAPSAPRHGTVLATTRGLGVGDPLVRGATLYGRAFRLSEAQGGTWSVRTRSGTVDGFAWGHPKHGDVSPQSVVATIDAGDVGCPALSP